jgi:radical SAM/Cys-rich protein
MGKRVMVRSNLAIYTEPCIEKHIPELLAEDKIKIIASLPCYTEEVVDSVRGNGTYKKAISVLKHLNSLGYGRENSGLEIDIMYNPAKVKIASEQIALENAYKEKLSKMHGIIFNRLLVLSNMPIGRLKKSMTDDEQREYLKLLEEKFNPDTVENLMCRYLISISPDGRLFDCDFWQMLNLPVKSKCSNIDSFDYTMLGNREIVTLPLCLMCTAGAGVSCSGTLV